MSRTTLSTGTQGDAVERHEPTIRSKALTLLWLNPQFAVGPVDLFKESASHSIIALRPAAGRDQSPNRKRSVSTMSQQVIPTRYLEYLVAQAAIAHNVTMTKSVYETLYGNPVLRASAGYVFESMVHRICKKGGQLATTIRPLTGTSATIPSGQVGNGRAVMRIGHVVRCSEMREL
jgi:hypothetical protein